MIDALMYAVRDHIRSAGFNFGIAECEIMDDGRPPPRCGNFFAAVHGGKDANSTRNNLDERYSFLVTLTMRVVVPLDRVGDQQVYRNIARVLVAEREGFRAKVDQLRRLLHMNWSLTVLTGQTPWSANDNLVAWTSGTVYGFIEPARYTGASDPRLVGGEWFASDPEANDVGVVSELSFEGARRMQPQIAAVGPYT